MAGKPQSEAGVKQMGGLGEAMRPLVHAAPLYLVAFVLLYRPMACGVVPQLGSLASFGMLLLAALFFWVAEGVLAGTLRWRAGAEAAWFAAFMLWGIVSSARGNNGLASAKLWCLFATYGLTGFLVLQLAGSGPERRFLVSCVLATVVTLAAYAILHYALYRPAFGEWIRSEPDYFKALFDVRGAGFQDFYIRVTGNRAVGNFLTSNQLAAFLLVGVFSLCGLTVAAWKGRGAEGARRGCILVATGCVAGSLIVLAGLLLSRSKGAMIAAAFGLVVLAAVSAWGWIQRNPFKTLAAAGIAAALFLVGQRLGVAPGWQRFEASLGVRLDYWRVSMQMIRDHPVVGVGPGCWEDNYVMRKLPQYEETRMAHSCFLQTWSEMGTVGFVLFALLCGAFLARALRGVGAMRESAQAVPSWDFRLAGMVLGAVAFALDGFFVGTFKPPQVAGPRLLQAAPWLAYVLLFGIWVAAFAAIYQGLSGRSQQSADRAERFVTIGLLGGISAFLLHSAAEFTFRVPALGGTAFAVGALLLMCMAAPRMHLTRTAGARGSLLLLLAFVPAMAWAGLAAPRAFDHSWSKARAFQLRAELSGKKEQGLPSRPLSADEMLKKRREIIEAYRGALRAVPWDSECWHDLAIECLVVARELGASPPSGAPRRTAGDEVRSLLAEAEDAALRAVRFNPLKAQNHLTTGMILSEAGRQAEAVPYFERTAQLHPSVPESWFLLGEALERAEGLKPESRACAAYSKAHALNVRQMDAHGRVIKGQYHERNLLGGEQALELERRLEACAAGKKG